MNCKQRIGLLAVALSCSLDLAEAQNNLNNIEAINGANSIDEINGNSDNNSNNVLDSEELNNNNSNLNSSGNLNSENNFNNNENNFTNNENNFNNNENDFTNNENNFTNNENTFSNNTLNNNSNNEFGNNLTQGNAESTDSSTDNFSANLEPSNSELNSQTAISNSQDSDSGQNLSTETSTGFSNSAGNSLNGFPPNNSGVADPFAANSSGPSTLPDEISPFPQNGDVFPPDTGEPGVIAEIPDAQLNTTNSTQTEAERKTQERAEKRKQKQELARKMAENIPPLNPGEAPPEYTVQPGDTLWDISDQLLDDALWWPRLWVLNPDIQDPDEIEPGMKILFYPSVAGEAPALVVRDTVDGFGAPKIDPSVLQTFSMKANRWIGKNGELVNAADLPGDQNLLTGGDMGAVASYTFHLPGFMTNSEIETAGEVIGNRNMPLIAGKGQRLIARFNNGTPNPGERFVAIRHRPVFSSLTDVGGQAELYNYVGVLGVVKNTSAGYSVMVPEESMAYVSPTDLLIPLSKSLVVSIDPDSSGRPNTAPGRVLSTQDGTYSYAGPGAAVFLQGLDGNNPYNIGDDVELFMPVGSGMFPDDEIGGREKVATARVVETNSDSAVAVILKASREVSAGALTYPGEN